MKFLSLRPMMWSRELQQTIDFYTQVLGFTCAEYNDDWGWAVLQRDDIEIMVAIPNEHTPFDKPMFTGSLYIVTDNVDYWWERLKDKVKLCYDIEDFEYNMREFAFYDNNGYLLQYGQEIEGDED